MKLWALWVTLSSVKSSACSNGIFAAPVLNVHPALPLVHCSYHPLGVLNTGFLGVLKNKQ